jgi:hypothetical protein
VCGGKGRVKAGQLKCIVRVVRDERGVTGLRKSGEKEGVKLVDDDPDTQMRNHQACGKHIHTHLRGFFRRE